MLRYYLVYTWCSIAIQYVRNKSYLALLVLAFHTAQCTGKVYLYQVADRYVFKASCSHISEINRHIQQLNKVVPLQLVIAQLYLVFIFTFLYSGDFAAK